MSRLLTPPVKLRLVDTTRLVDKKHEARGPRGHAGFAKRSSRDDKRFEYWKRLRAPGWPGFLRSFLRASRVRKPARFSVGRRSASDAISARATP
mgnify:CR=1 FL=1